MKEEAKYEISIRLRTQMVTPMEQTPTILLEPFQLLIAQLFDGCHHHLESSFQTLPQDHVIWLCP